MLRAEENKMVTHATAFSALSTTLTNDPLVEQGTEEGYQHSLDYDEFTTVLFECTILLPQRKDIATPTLAT
jgi:hypothetical protein